MQLSEVNDQTAGASASVETPRSSAAKRARPDRTEELWQRRLLPLMGGMLVALTVFFFVASFVQLYYLQTRIESAPQLDLRPAMASFDDFERDLKKAGLNDTQAFERRFEYARWKTLLLLDANALQRRYHQAGVLLISRTWIRYLGFITGTILALVGAAFILGKLRETGSELGAESPLWKVSMSTASPGLILAALGTVLMLATLGTSFDLQVNDGPVYLPRQAVVQPDIALPLPDPASILDKMKRDGAQKH